MMSNKLYVEILILVMLFSLTRIIMQLITNFSWMIELRRRRKKKALQLFRTSSFVLRYIVSQLRERALSTDCQYISATIFDGLNNCKEKKSSNTLEKEKGLRQKKPSGFGVLKHELPWISHELFMNYFFKTTNRANLHEFFALTRIIM